MIDTNRLFRFSVTGGVCAALHFFLTWMFVDGLQLPITLSSTIAFVLAGIYNYSAHYYWTFSSDAPHGWVLVKYLMMVSGGMFINGVVMYLGVMFLPVHYLAVQFLAAVCVAAWSFVAGSFWVFTRGG